MDLSKAFDCFPHELILEKLKFYGLHDRSIQLLRSYLSSCHQRVKVRTTYSSWMGVSAGVPPGSILGPMLLNIFMNDLIYAVKDYRLIRYADDTKINLAHQNPQIVEEGINRELDNTMQWFQQNGMLANPDKYQALVLGNTEYEVNFKCADVSIPVSKEINLLGITIDNKLKFEAHVASVCRKVGGHVNALNRLKNILLRKTEKAVYRAFILPHFYYCSQVRHHCGARNTKKLERVNERALRYVYKDKETPYAKLLEWIGLGATLESLRIQDMLLTVNSCFQGSSPTSVA